MKKYILLLFSFLLHLPIMGQQGQVLDFDGVDGKFKLISEHIQKMIIELTLSYFLIKQL
jgi:hypothetical protein